MAVSAIKSILKFVSHDKSATSSNQADLFDCILERERKVKHLSLYQERRFTKLSYSCTSILDAIPYIQMVVDETHLNNQHVEMVRMLLDSELVLIELNGRMDTLSPYIVEYRHINIEQPLSDLEVQLLKDIVVMHQRQ